MKILAVSDVESKYIWDFFDPAIFRNVDMIISCGDLKPEYLSFLVTMIPAPLFYVHGNHDKCYKYNPPLGCQCIDGKLVTYKGARIMGLGGCKSPRQEPHEYTDRQMWQRFKKLVPELKRAGGVDILVTHAPAECLGDGPDPYHMGFEVFRYIDETWRPKLHIFGHRHMMGNPVSKTPVFAFGCTTMVNATGYRIIDLETEDSAMEDEKKRVALF
jgi:Icc-related predicted phosphoesterase